jgi:heme-degrading monooxygenase HmoA
MISRHWQCIAKPASSDEYVHHLQSETFPALRSIPGFVEAWVQRRTVGAGVEFVVITHWESMESIRKFTGVDTEEAVVPGKARDMMVEFERRVRHYEIV